MSDSTVKFRHEVIDPDPPGEHIDVTLIADVNGNGRQDIIIGGKIGDPNVYWYENPSWTRHALATVPPLEAGGVVLDINGDGRPDFVAGCAGRGKELYWFENPADPTGLWKVHLIENQFERYHDQAIGDIDGDGKPEILISSQNVGVIAYYDIPEDPTVSPWPRACCHVLAEDMPKVEGLAVVDIDGDGRNEVFAGPNIFRQGPGGTWEKQSFATDYVMTRLAIADYDGDGVPEVVLAEGESHPARLSICKAPDWEPKILMEGLFHPHSLEVADFNGDGLPDVFVGEMGLGQNPNPRMIVLVNKGGAEFETVVIQEGIPVHEAKVGDLTGDGRIDIVGKPYHPDRHIDVWYNEK